MRAALTIIAALGLGLFSSSVWAQFGGPPPVSSYTLNIVLESASGEVLYNETMKCQTLKRCDSADKELLVAGQPRLFAIVFRWDGAQLDYECWFKPNTEAEKRAMPMNSRPTGKIVLKNKETAEELLYNTRNGVADRAQYEKGPIAKVRFEVKI